MRSQIGILAAACVVFASMCFGERPRWENVKRLCVVIPDKQVHDRTIRVMATEIVKMYEGTAFDAADAKAVADVMRYFYTTRIAVRRKIGVGGMAIQLEVESIMARLCGLTGEECRARIADGRISYDDMIDAVDAIDLTVEEWPRLTGMPGLIAGCGRDARTFAADCGWGK